MKDSDKIKKALLLAEEAIDEDEMLFKELEEDIDDLDKLLLDISEIEDLIPYK